MNRVCAPLLIFLITATCTLGIEQPNTTGDHSYRIEVEVGCNSRWQGTVNNKKSTLIYSNPASTTQPCFPLTLTHFRDQIFGEACPGSGCVFCVRQIQLIIEWGGGWSSLLCCCVL